MGRDPFETFIWRNRRTDSMSVFPSLLFAADEREDMDAKKKTGRIKSDG